MRSCAALRNPADPRRHIAFQWVAIKVLPPYRLADSERKRRFVREAQAASALNHPNSITVHEIDQQEGEDFLVMEYIDGKSLAHVIQSGCGSREAVKYGLQIADGLAAAHAAGQTIGRTEPGLVLGTAGYLSPEQVRGRVLDPQSDQFLFGIIRYEMIFGAHPFRRESAPQILAAIIEAEPEPLPETVPLPLRWIVERCPAKDPSAR